MHLVIVAGGIGSRLAPLANHIPKFLVNIGKETGFVKQIEYWKQYSPDSITVIVNSAYAELVKAYYDLYFGTNEQLLVPQDNGLVKIPFIVKTVDEVNGSAHAIMVSCRHLDNQSVMFTWCDVIPGETFDIEELNYDGAVAFTNYDYPNRYDLIQIGTGWEQRVPAIRADGRGGIFGVYYVSAFTEKPFNNGQDFVEILTKYSYNGGVREIKMTSIIDFGDMAKLEHTRSSADAARSFNAVEFHGDLVLKRALNAQGQGLIAKEIAWYSELDKINSTVSRPEFWPNRSGTSFVMSKVQGIPVYQLWSKLNDEGRAMVLNRIFAELDKLHALKSERNPALNMIDIQEEALLKLLKRYDEIRNVIDAFGPVQIVNGWELRNHPKVTMMHLYEELQKEYGNHAEARLIHGDLQMSNAMINPDTLAVTFIDPRGYFGKNITYGCADYDIAKLLYSLSGYDLFNYSKTFHLSYIGPSLASGSHQWVLNFDIPKPNRSGCESIIGQRFKRVHYLWLAVIWCGLAQYIKNDPVKMLAAHYHGLAMAERALEGQFTL